MCCVGAHPDARQAHSVGRLGRCFRSISLSGSRRLTASVFHAGVSFYAPDALPKIALHFKRGWRNEPAIIEPMVQRAQPRQIRGYFTRSSRSVAAAAAGLGPRPARDKQAARIVLQQLRRGDIVDEQALAFGATARDI